jgi:glycosyltransferase involved in cell wall biosynthesis
MDKLNISAIVVGLNEGDLLSKCLSGLSFCDEIVYFDLESTDNSIEIAKSYGAKIIKHEKVPGVEWIHAEYAKKLKHDWVLFTDPDEYIDPILQKEIITVFPYLENHIGAIKVPIQFYFGMNQLKGTNWGGRNQRILMANTNRFIFEKRVHSGRILLENYEFYTIIYNKGNILHHYWMRNFKQLFEKHKRYLSKEGESRYNINNRINNPLELFFVPLISFRNCFFQNKGYKDGYVGLFLSFFWAWYQTLANIELFKYQIKKNKETA